MSLTVLTHLRADGVSVLVQIPAVGLPIIVHWGADLGDLAEPDARALAAASEPLVVNNQPDEPVAVAVLPEGHTGWPGRPGLVGSRHTNAARGADWSPRFHQTRVTLDDQPIEGWAARGPAALVVESIDRDAGLALTVALELTSAGLLRGRSTVTNVGAGDYHLDELSMALPVPSRAREVLDFAGRWAKERVPQRSRLGVGIHLKENRRGRTGPDAATVLHLGVPGYDFGHGEVWGLHVGWSGNHRHWAERVYSGEQVLGGGELLLPGEVTLVEGQSYATPWIHGAYGVGLDQVARRFHHHLRARPNHPQAPRPVTLNVWEAVYFDHDLIRLRTLADHAAQLGVERFVLDDGWFGARRDDSAGLGDWVVSPQAWPDGLHPLVDHVTGLGMEFGLWVEPEMINIDSDLARAHPEWIMAPGERLPVESRSQQVLNLGIDACRRHVRDQLLAVLETYDIGYLKWDHNRDLVEAADRSTGRAAVHEQTLAAYRLMDELKDRRPGLEIESCASGGLRIDLGVLEHTDRVWVSDCIDPLERRQIQRWTTQLLPPELMGSHVASGRSHITGRSHDLSFRVLTALPWHFGLEWDLSEADADELIALQEAISEYKRLREVLHRGDLVRVDTGDETVEIQGVISADRTRAVLQYAMLGRSEVSVPAPLRVPGLDVRRRYAVRPLLADPAADLRAPSWWPPGGAAAELSGSALAIAGVQPPVLQPEHAVLLEITALD